MEPELGSARRLIMRSSVDLPAPERPMTPTICPCGMSKVTESTASLFPNRRETFLSSNIVLPFRGCRAAEISAVPVLEWARAPASKEVSKGAGANHKATD